MALSGAEKARFGFTGRHAPSQSKYPIRDAWPNIPTPRNAVAFWLAVQPDESVVARAYDRAHGPLTGTSWHDWKAARQSSRRPASLKVAFDLASAAIRDYYAGAYDAATPLTATAVEANALAVRDALARIAARMRS